MEGNQGLEEVGQNIVDTAYHYNKARVVPANKKRREIIMKDALQYYERPYREPIWLRSGKLLELSGIVREDKEAGWKIRGFPASPGVVEGPATLITDHRDFIKVKTGTILVCPHAAPTLTAVFSKIKGLVTDTGGMLSPAATIAREYGIPAVSGTSVATEAINEGDIIRVNGARGRVEIISRAK